MSYREIPVNMALDMVVAVGESMGLSKKIEVSDHSISVELTNPDKDTRAWDSNMYRNGNLFVQGYANPIKPRVDHNTQLEDPDTVEVEEGDSGTESDSEDGEGRHVNLISSSRYRDYMRQDLVSQLLTPKEQWKLIAYGVLALGVLQFVGICVTLYGTGAF